MIVYMYYGLLPEIKLSYFILSYASNHGVYSQLLSYKFAKIVNSYLILSYASNHGDLVIYLNDSWNYKLKSCQTDSQIWEKQIIEIFNPNNLTKKDIIIGNVYRPPYNSKDSYTTFSLEFNAVLIFQPVF